MTCLLSIDTPWSFASTTVTIERRYRGISDVRDSGVVHGRHRGHRVGSPHPTASEYIRMSYFQQYEEPKPLSIFSRCSSDIAVGHSASERQTRLFAGWNGTSAVFCTTQYYWYVLAVYTRTEIHAPFVVSAFSCDMVPPTVIYPSFAPITKDGLERFAAVESNFQLL